MTKATEKIDALLARLEQTGADPERLEALRRTQRFKRSWVDLAQTLVELRRGRAYEAWGYEDFYAYCTQELFLKRPTVDKLTMSFSTLQRLAPSVLQWDGVEREIPSYQAVDYFGRAMGTAGGKADGGARAANDPAPGAPPPREVIKDLRHAVFDEGQSVAELRRRFDPILHPRPAGSEQLEILHKAIATARKLAELLPDVDGLTDKRVAVTEKALGGLRQDLEALAEPLREKLERAKKRTAKKSVQAEGGPAKHKKAPPRPGGATEAAGRG
ncbi:hypothetical protein [Paraliomyxa miuraensis]|uniref:hypothetical protein n=1 Tax=Paraliomyxa miuraensis TaxID=376150 RepID=UPI00224C9C55|nr:hypothetical protein [Paraliomyxa miuraensis]MCX4240053.1 hypothetical protein [Paraliomyxa miuraensis]